MSDVPKAKGRTHRDQMAAILETEEGRREYDLSRVQIGAGEIVCSLMRDHGLSRKALAKKAGVKKKALKRILRCDDGMSLDILAKCMFAMERPLLLISCAAGRDGQVPDGLSCVSRIEDVQSGVIEPAELPE